MKHVSIVRWAAAIALCAFGVAVPASAQITTGTVSGSVKDSQGGMVPGATVVLISESRGTKSVAAVTNETGDYVLPNITPDTYTIEISMPGFKTLKRSGVAVSGGDRVAAGALVIEIGGATETVDVTAEAPLIQASSGERSFTVTTSAVENLPLSNRNFANLTQLTPGVSGTTTRLGGGGQNNIMMDGVSTMDTGNNGQMLQMNVEAIAEVKVLTSGYQAEYGRSSGLQITAVTKSGTNRIHGSLYDVERNSDWNENSWVNEKNGLPKTIQKERDWGYSVGGPVGKPGGVNKLFFFYSHEYRPRESGRQVNRFRVPTVAERAGNFSQSTDQNGNPIPNLADFTGANGGVFPGKTIPADRLYQPGLAILKLWPEPNTTGLNYNYEVELPTVNTLIQQPAFRLDYQPWSAWRLTGKYAGQMRSHELNSIGGAAAPGIATRIPGFNDYVEPYPWIGTISITNNLTLNPTTFIEATYGWVQNQLGSMITSPVSNRFNAGLGDLPLLFPDAGVIDSRYYELKPLEASGTPYFQDGRILLPPTFQWGNRVANAPPSLGFPGFMNVNRTQDFSISLTKVWDRHTIKAGFYLNHSYKAQNLGAGGGASFQGNISFANDTANPLDTGFGFANAALGVFTSYQQQSKFVEGSFIYDQIDWYVQDNWKVNSKLTLDYGLRFVNQRPQYDQYLQSSNFFPERWSAGAAPALYVPGCAGTSPCSGTNRQARNPVTGALLGPNTSLAIGQLVANNGNALNGIVKAGDGIAKGNYEWPTIGYAPRFGAAYDLTGSQRFVLRGGAGLFFDRPNGNSVFSQVGNPPFSTATTVRYSQLQSLGSGGLTTQGPPSLIVFKYDSELPSSYQWNAGVQFALPWSVSGDVSYVGQHGFNLLQNVDINGVDFGVAFAGAAQDATVTRQRDAWRFRAVGRSAASLPRLRCDSAELGHRLQHLPLDSDVVQPPVPQRLLGRVELHARPVQHRHGRQSGPARPSCRWVVLDPRRSGRAGRAAEGSRPAPPHHQGQRGVGPAEDGPRLGWAAHPGGRGQRLAALGDSDCRHRRALQRRLQLRRRRGRQRAGRHQCRRHRQPEPDRLADLRATHPHHRGPGLGLFRQPVRPVQHRGVHGADGVGLQSQSGPRVGAELSARLLRQDDRPGAGAQLPDGRHPQHPVPDRSVQRLQRRGLQLAEQHAAGDQPAGADHEQPAVRRVGQPGADPADPSERRLRRRHRSAAHALDAGADPVPVLSLRPAGPHVRGPAACHGASGAAQPSADGPRSWASRVSRRLRRGSAFGRETTRRHDDNNVVSLFDGLHPAGGTALRAVAGVRTSQSTSSCLRLGCS